jgi:hypothetical protein
LEHERTEEKTANEPEGEEFYYEEPDISGRTKEVDYDIVYGVEDEEAEQDN